MLVYNMSTGTVSYIKYSNVSLRIVMYLYCMNSKILDCYCTLSTFRTQLMYCVTCTVPVPILPNCTSYCRYTVDYD